MGFDGTGAGYNPRTRKKHKNERPTFSYLFFKTTNFEWVELARHFDGGTGSF